MKSFDVLCITLINLNLLAKPVDRSLFDRDATQAEEYSVVVGGDGTNQAVTLSQLGWRTGVCGSIGDDHFGQLALQMLSERGVDTSAVTCKPGQQTAVCFVMIGPDGERNFLVKRGACDAFHLGDIPPDLFLRTRVLNIGSLFTFRQLYGKPLAGLLRQAQEHGVLTSADAMYDTYQLGPKSMDDVLPFLDYFFPSYGEAKYLTGECDAERMADALLAHGVKTVVIKLGADGCLLKNGTGKAGWRRGQFYRRFPARRMQRLGRSALHTDGVCCRRDQHRGNRCYRSDPERRAGAGLAPAAGLPPIRNLGP